MSRIILFNADDWGLSRQIHESITGLHRAGALDAAGIMMGQPFTAQAASYAASHPGFLTGIHLFASDRDCKPLSARNWPFLWPEDFWVNTAVHLPAVEGLILAEVDAQLAAWKDTGLPLRFVNSHFHFHANHRLFHRIAEAILRHFPRFDGWIRLGDSRPMTGGLRGVLDPLMDLIESGAFTRDWRGRNNDSLLGIDRTFANSAADVAGACGKLGDGFHEFFFHPGRSWKLTESGSDHAALLELARLLPASVRNVALLLPGHLAPNHTAAFVAPAFFSQHAEPISTQSTHSMHTLNLPELDGGVEILAATPPAPFAFKAKMSIDGDGSPRAYHPDNTGLDHIDNAGRPGNWWGIVTRNGRPDGTPVVQTAEDPCPGYYVSATALVDPSVSNPHKPARYVDSEKIPYVVLPRGGGSGARLGDFATAVHLENGRVSHAIYADIGPRNQYGEGSMALAGALGLSPNPRRGGTSSRIIAYVFYPLSGNGRPRTTEEIEREGARLFEQWGGMDRVRELFANGGGGAGFGPSGLEILSEQAPDLSTIDGRIRAAEEALDLEALQSLRDSVLEHSELQQEEGEMAPRVEIFPDESFFEALGLSPAIAALDVGGMLGVVNRIVHAERWVRFVLDKRNRPHLPVIVAEGDSWFLHPLIHETLDCLREDSYNIRSLAATVCVQFIKHQEL